MFLNTQAAPFNDARVRRALNLAADRERMVELVGGPLVARTTCQILPPTSSGYEPYCPYTLGSNAAGTWTAPDLATARRLVAESGTRGMRVEVVGRGDRPEFGYFVSLLRALGYRSSQRVLPRVHGVLGVCGGPTEQGADRPAQLVRRRAGSGALPAPSLRLRQRRRPELLAVLRPQDRQSR